VSARYTGKSLACSFSLFLSFALSSSLIAPARRLARIAVAFVERVGEILKFRVTNAGAWLENKPVILSNHRQDIWNKTDIWEQHSSQEIRAFYSFGFKNKISFRQIPYISIFEILSGKNIRLAGNQISMCSNCHIFIFFYMEVWILISNFIHSRVSGKIERNHFAN